MYFSLFLVYLISHITFDFIFQHNNILKLRFPKDNSIKSILKGNFIHSFFHFLGMNLFLLGFYLANGQPLEILNKCILIITIFHFSIDCLKSGLILKKPWLKEDVIIFLLDQFLHLLVIINVFILCEGMNFKEGLIKLLNYRTRFTSMDRFLSIILIILICTNVTGIFIKVLIRSLTSKKYIKARKNNIYIPIKNDNTGAENGGLIIGILERSFILLIMAINQAPLIGFVLATKSIARFKKLEDESFAEYFIIGTFISFIIAMIGGKIIYTLL
ncbi:DUF3307 domain-containing protein [Clostridium senegalense]|uniref:DUF3307 domain-containing protein n=1 Tax=Clostridium senegalense TaxID=1465809 RepID=UPI001C10B51E|nr:DUF3307 domain-containing protein [Clostridium senegalense]MBU5226994.1 DUF3307 domain-containing protein [Clostridium senegalense]